MVEEDYCDSEYLEEEDDSPPDSEELEARETLQFFFENRQKDVFYSRQIEVLHEQQYFHWITNRAIRHLEEDGFLNIEWKQLENNSSIKIISHKKNRYYKRSANRLVDLVNQFSDSTFGHALGEHSEMLILQAFARCQFIWQGEDTSEFQGKIWEDSNHDLDFIFEKDGVSYGIEVKNTLRYMDYEEFQTKIELCSHLGVRPVFAVRMLPKTWIKELVDSGGFALILKYQMYPLFYAEFAKKVAQELSLPVDSPRVIQEGTMNRFLRWHQKNV